MFGLIKKEKKKVILSDNFFVCFIRTEENGSNYREIDAR